MLFFPYTKYFLKSKLTSNQLKEKFGSISQLPLTNTSGVLKTFINSRNTDSFQCDLYKNHLIVSEKVDFKVGGYTNSFRPEAKLLFEDDENGTTYIVTMMPNAGIIVFLICIVLFIIIAGILYAVQNIHDGKLSPSSYLPIFCLIFLYILSTAAFNRDLPQIETFVFDLLEIET